MTFKDGQPIYIQIAERLQDEILAKTYAADERVPSVREYAALLEVNPNTAVKAYDLLTQRGIIYNRRGLGFFVSADASERISSERRASFFAEELPALLQRMRQLGITLADIANAWEATNGEAAANPA